MSTIIAVAGKGGTGKTTLCAFIIKHLIMQKAGSILAIDADPNSNLGELLGVEVKEDIGSILEEVLNNQSIIPKGTSKNSYIDYRVQTSIIEGYGFDLLTMGLPEGPGCYCYANNVLKNIVSKLIESYDFVIVDNEAGMEHLSRKILRSGDQFLVISDPSIIGIRSALRILSLLKALKFKFNRKAVLINKLKGNNKGILQHFKDSNLDFITSISYDQEVLGASLTNMSVFKQKEGLKLSIELEALTNKLRA